MLLCEQFFLLDIPRRPKAFPLVPLKRETWHQVPLHSTVEVDSKIRIKNNKIRHIGIELNLQYLWRILNF
jgi:hypothetical protein